MSVPNVFPLLSIGGHETPEAGGCIMEITGYLAGEEWGDHPKCVDYALADLARDINDQVDDHHRQLLLNYVNRFIGTADQQVTLTEHLETHFENSGDDIVNAWQTIVVGNFREIRDLNWGFWGGLNAATHATEHARISADVLTNLDQLLSLLEEANATYATPIQPDQLVQVKELLTR